MVNSTSYVIATQTNGGWASDPQARAFGSFAAHLQRDIIVLQNPGGAKLYTSFVPTNQQAQTSIDSLSLMQALQGLGEFGLHYHRLLSLVGAQQIDNGSLITPCSDMGQWYQSLYRGKLTWRLAVCNSKLPTSVIKVV